MTLGWTGRCAGSPGTSRCSCCATAESPASRCANRCPHLSGPLHKGELSEVDGQLCVTCPWHASVFRLRDGGVVHGPAPVPGFESRVEGGVLQVRVRTLPGVSAS
jgi:nitrite reductase/ring-hydroxylating ferredoxin subunit